MTRKHADPVFVKRLLLLAVLLPAVFGLLTGCGRADKEARPGDEEIWGTAPAEDPGIAVETGYKTIYYPREWENKVEVLDSTVGDACTVSFQTKVSGRDVLLFSIVMSPAQEDGYLLGSLKQDDAQIRVYSVMNEMPPQDWSEEAYSEICTLQERVNDIIIQFHEDERFVPNN